MMIPHTQLPLPQSPLLLLPSPRCASIPLSVICSNPEAKRPSCDVQLEGDPTYPTGHYKIASNAASRQTQSQSGVRSSAPTRPTGKCADAVRRTRAVSA